MSRFELVIPDLERFEPNTIDAIATALDKAAIAIRWGGLDPGVVHVIALHGESRGTYKVIITRGRSNESLSISVPDYKRLAESAGFSVGCDPNNPTRWIWLGEDASPVLNWADVPAAEVHPTEMDAWKACCTVYELA